MKKLQAMKKKYEAKYVKCNEETHDIILKVNINSNGCEIITVELNS